MRQPPNIVWLCADDFAPAMCGAYGNDQVKTPAIDRIANRGLRFDRAYCACPLSTPSRQAFWTGRYPRSIGVTLSPTPLPADETTLPTLLRTAGYEIASFGKTHFYSPRTDEFDLCLDYPDYKRWFSRRGPGNIPARAATLGPWRPFFDPASVWLNSSVLPYPAADEAMFGTYLARGAADYLQSSPSGPFFLYVSFFETHSPFAFPVEFAGRHAAEEFSAPEVSAGDREVIPPVFRGLTNPEKRGIQAAYATSTEFMDKNVGIVLDALDASGQRDNTVVVFTSDHGYLLGQHGRFEKHCCFEEAVRAALIVSIPGMPIPCRSTSALIELIDLAPTILELCDQPVPQNVQGRSFTSLLLGHTDVHRSSVVMEYSDNSEAAIFDGRWKLIYSSMSRRRRDGYGLDRAVSGPHIQLFDLENDAEEQLNLAHESASGPHLRGLIDQLAAHVSSTDRRHRGRTLTRPQDIFEACLTPVELC